MTATFEERKKALDDRYIKEIGDTIFSEQYFIEDDINMFGDHYNIWKGDGDDRDLIFKITFDYADYVHVRHRRT
ncbi:MAG: hypothetical protein HZB68_04110 [Candidatus Aenigmarchaeota archaeon]|nr:hypothetical protein [Candidatus Aenigmarchaeota archaeon]